MASRLPSSPMCPKGNVAGSIRYVFFSPVASSWNVTVYGFVGRFKGAFLMYGLTPAMLVSFGRNGTAGILRGEQSATSDEWRVARRSGKEETPWLRTGFPTAPVRLVTRHFTDEGPSVR